MLFANKPREYVVSFREIIFILAAFVFILVILYPKSNLEKQVLSENTNYNLSIIYLKNMIRSDPTSEPLMLSLAQKSLKAGKLHLALGIVGLLYKSTDAHIRKEAYLLGYQLEKATYYFAKDSQGKEEAIQALKSNLSVIVQQHYYDTKESYHWYQEALFLKETQKAYQFIQITLKEHPDNIAYLKDAYYLSEQVGKSTESIQYLHALQRHDGAHLSQWLEEEYQFLVKIKHIAQAESLLLKLAPGSVYWSNKLAEFYNAQNEQIKSAMVYKRLFQTASTYSKKKHYYLLAIKMLRAGNHTKMASDFAYKYQNRFLKEREMRILLLKLYTAAGDVPKAASLSKKILDKKD
ncbi:hypothetical protein [Sulfurospirillum sp. 1612]|uniref:hypothetical protein n=1 Tax=Sulfurospirillum sp. 1612 TaxID=3094835 RepID=UPI002F93A62B